MTSCDGSFIYRFEGPHAISCACEILALRPHPSFTLPPTMHFDIHPFPKSSNGDLIYLVSCYSHRNVRTERMGAYLLMYFTNVQPVAPTASADLGGGLAPGGG